MTPRPTPEPEPTLEPTAALNKTAKFATFAIDYASVARKEGPPPIEQAQCDVAVNPGWDPSQGLEPDEPCAPSWRYTIRFRALPGKSPAVIDRVRTRLYDSSGKEWVPEGGRDFIPIRDAGGDVLVIDFKPDGTDSFIGLVHDQGAKDATGTYECRFCGARVQLEFQHEGSSAVAKISFVLKK
jgi:hypothetical protein